MPISSPLPALRIDLLKITGYLLNLDSPQGHAKAKYFLSYGFSPDDPNTLAQALFSHAQASFLESRLATQYGTSLVFRGKPTCPNGPTTSDVRSVWQIAAGAKEGRFVTAFPCRSPVR